MSGWVSRSTLLILGVIVLFGTGVYLGRHKRLQEIGEILSTLKGIESSSEDVRVALEKPKEGATPSPEAPNTNEESEGCLPSVWDLGYSLVNLGDSSNEHNTDGLAFLQEVNEYIGAGKSLGTSLERAVGLLGETDEGFVYDYSSSSNTRDYVAMLGHRIYEATELFCPSHTFGHSVIVILDKSINKAFAILPSEISEVVAFSDLDGDNRIELLTRESIGGNCWACDSLHLYRIQDGRLREVSFLSLIGSHGIRGIVEAKDKNVKGVTFEVLDTNWEVSLSRPHAAGIGLTKFVRVYGEQISEVTPEYKEEILKDFPHKDDTEATLLMYETIGERQKGMETFEKEYAEAIRQAPDSDSRILHETILNEFRRQYRESERFQPFNTDGKDRIILRDPMIITLPLRY